jgi:T5SS/PEP-CTERM-associated repeat protein
MCPSLVLAILLVPVTSRAVDRDWNVLGPSITGYETGTNWTPNGTPSSLDNVTFPLDGDVDVVLGAASVSNGLTVSNGIVDFIGFGSATLTSSGVVLIDDTAAGSLAAGTFVTLNGTSEVDWTVAGGLTLGDAGFGTFTVNNGAAFNVGSGVTLGNALGSEGVVNVSGDDSFFALSAGTTTAGNLGAGTINIDGGGHLDADQLVLGFEGSAYGTVNVDGVGTSIASQLTASRIDLGDVDESGGGGEINITNGGLVSVGTAFIAGGTDSTGDISITGSDSMLIASGEFYLGSRAAATMTINAGSYVGAGTSSLYVGRLANSTGQLTIENGGSVFSPGTVQVGQLFGAEGIVTVDGGTLTVGVLAQTADDLIVGGGGTGTLTIMGGGSVSVEDDLFLGNEATSTGANQIIVTGATSSLVVDDQMLIGSSGNGAMSVLAGATVTSSSTHIATANDSVASVIVDGENSLWNVVAGATTGYLIVGNEGDANLEISNGGRVQAVELYVGDSDTDALMQGGGEIWIHGATGGGIPSTLDIASAVIEVGGSNNEDGGFGYILVTDGGLLNSRAGIIGSGDGTGVVTISGANSFWNAQANGNGTLYVGDTGAGELYVEDGGRVDTAALIVGDAAGSENALVHINGSTLGPAVATMNVDAGFIVGNGRPGDLTVVGGGILNTGSAVSQDASIGLGAAADGSSITIDGQGSQWNYSNSGRMRVGVAGGTVADPSLLTISGGGAVDVAGSFWINDGAAGGYGRTTITGDDGMGGASTLTVAIEAIIADDGDGRLDVEAGGVMNVVGFIDIGGALGNAVAYVTGPGSLTPLRRSAHRGTKQGIRSVHSRRRHGHQRRQQFYC